MNTQLNRARELKRSGRFREALVAYGEIGRPTPGILAESAQASSPPSTRLLEIGSAWGAFSAAAAYRGFDVVGLEASPAAARFAQSTLGVDTVVGSAPQDLPDGPFGVVALWEVIEHFTRPGDVLAALADRMAPGALLALSTPCLDHPIHRARGFDDPMWCVPGHLVYLDRQTLGSVLDKAGFDMEKRWMSPRHLGSVCAIARRR